MNKSEITVTLYAHRRWYYKAIHWLMVIAVLMRITTTDRAALFVTKHGYRISTDAPKGSVKL